jgi:hypothetical protein
MMGPFFNSRGPRLRVVAVLLFATLSYQIVEAAVGKVSRACRNDWIPATVSVMNRVMLTVPKSMLPGQRSLDYSFVNEGELPKNWWLMESFTTDYSPENSPTNPQYARYWLWATAEVFLANAPAESSPTNYHAYRQYHSYWAAKYGDNELMQDPRIGILSALRLVQFWRARAGTGNYPLFFVKAVDSTFKVKGHHFFLDTNNVQLYDIGLTTATGCQFDKWGFWDEAE